MIRLGTYNRDFNQMHRFVMGFITFVFLFIVFWGFLIAFSFMEENNMMGDYTWGINGVVETRCIDGYKFVISDGSRYGGNNIRQMIDQNGHSIPCK